MDHSFGGGSGERRLVLCTYGNETVSLLTQVDLSTQRACVDLFHIGRNSSFVDLLSHGRSTGILAIVIQPDDAATGPCQCTGTFEVEGRL